MAKMGKEITVDGFDDLLKDVSLKTKIDGMNDSVLKVALQHYLRNNWGQAGHRDKHTDHSECTCVLGGL